MDDPFAVLRSLPELAGSAYGLIPQRNQELIDGAGVSP